MKFQEPKAEFVEIDLISTTADASSLCDQQTSKRASIETCTGPDAPYNNASCSNPPADMFG